MDLTLYTLPRQSDEGRVRRGSLAAKALYYIIGGHFGPPKSLSEHKKYEVLLGPPFFRAASGAAPPDRNGERRCEGENRRGRSWTRARRREGDRGKERERGRATGAGIKKAQKRVRKKGREEDEFELR